MGAGWQLQALILGAAVYVHACATVPGLPARFMCAAGDFDPLGHLCANGLRQPPASFFILPVTVTPLRAVTIRVLILGREARSRGRSLLDLETGALCGSSFTE